MPKMINFSRLNEIMADAGNKNKGPVYLEPVGTLNHNWADFNATAENKFVSDGSRFVWGYSKWGSTKRRVAE